MEQQLPGSYGTIAPPNVLRMSEVVHSFQNKPARASGYKQVRLPYCHSCLTARQVEQGRHHDDFSLSAEYLALYCPLSQCHHHEVYYQAVS